LSLKAAEENKGMKVSGMKGLPSLGMIGILEG